MAIHNPRIKSTFQVEEAKLLTTLVHQEHKSVSSLVRELTLEALEMREDYYFSKIAEKLDKKGVKTYGHDEIWS